MDLNRILSTSEEGRICIQPRIKMNKLHSWVFSHSDVNDACITPYMQVVNITGRTTCRTTMDSIYTTYNMSLSMWHANIPQLYRLSFFLIIEPFISFSWKQFLPSHNVSCLGFPPSTPLNSSSPSLLCGYTFFLPLIRKYINRILKNDNKIKYSKVKQKLIRWNSTKQTERKKSPRKGTSSRYRCRDPLVHTLKDPTKTLSWIYPPKNLKDKKR